MATITGRQIKNETVESEDIKDGTITSDDINLTDVNKAIPTRIIAGNNITISETGPRTGSGDVTINADPGGAHTIASHSDTTATGTELNTLTDGSETSLHKHDTLYLGITDKASDSDKLDNHDSSYFEPAFSKNTAFNDICNLKH